MYTTDMRFNRSYRTTSNDTVLSDQNGKGKPVLPAILRKTSPLTVSGLESESVAASEDSDIFSEEGSVSSVGGTEKNLFSNQEIQQVETSSLRERMLSAGYRNSNRGAVALGLAGGAVAGFVGMTVGSSIGTHSGALIGALQEYSKIPGDEIAIAVPEQGDHDVAQGNHFSEHVIQVVDHAGHHAAVGSIGVGVAALLTALATGNPMPVAFHAAGVYSGAAWGFGLVTGTASWIRRHVQRSSDAAQREQKNSPGDIELRRLENGKIQDARKIET